MKLSLTLSIILLLFAGGWIVRLKKKLERVFYEAESNISKDIIENTS